MDGNTATLKLRQSGFKTPIIALTANALDPHTAKSEALKRGFTEYLNKPLDRRILVENLRRLRETSANAESN